MNLTIFSEMSEGGIADYAHDQALALAARGVDVTMLCSPRFLESRTPSYRALPALRELRAGSLGGARMMRRLRLAAGMLHNKRVLADHVGRRGDGDVLMHFSEYLAPLWAPRQRRLTRRGVRFHSVLHDPVRDYQVGPKAWHDWSVREALSPLSNVFVHTMEPVALSADVPVSYIPYGVHHYPPPVRTRADVRRELGVPQDAPLLTSYGYIRDNKNLDLVIEAISAIPDVHLLIAGPEQAGGNRPVSEYRALAERLGCADRCHWVSTFLSGTETADLLCASDLSVLTYSRRFVSSSAALGVTANYRLPCLISSGSTTTERIVRQYGIGLWVEPDDAAAIRAGIEAWRATGLTPDWDGYARDNSWDHNAELVEAAILTTRAAER